VTWKQLLAENRVAAEPTSRPEIKDLRAVVHRNLADAQIRKLSEDGRYGHAYDAARILANIMVRASGYRVKGDGGGHYNTFLALKTADPAFAKKAVYFDACRRKRNTFLYEQANIVSHTEAEELLWHASGFSLEVDAWLKKHHPNLI
jgi:hypothetical protein